MLYWLLPCKGVEGSVSDHFKPTNWLILATSQPLILTLTPILTSVLKPNPPQYISYLTITHTFLCHDRLHSNSSMKNLLPVHFLTLINSCISFQSDFLWEIKIYAENVCFFKVFLTAFRSSSQLELVHWWRLWDEGEKVSARCFTDLNFTFDMRIILNIYTNCYSYFHCCNRWILLAVTDII